MKVEFKVEGLDKLLKSINQKPKTVKKLAGKEIDHSLLRAEGKAKQYAPWDTGWMSNNIYSEMTDELNGVLVSPTFYSIYQELGTRYQQPQPFIYPAMDEESPKLMRNLNTIMNR